MRISTFFSYKGGAGRSTTCLNTIPLLAEQFDAYDGAPILLLDMDIESAGLTYLLSINPEEVFKDYKAINAGFGGSTSDEALFHYERVAKPFAPKIVVWYYGDNEPVCSYTAEESKALFLATWEKFRKDFPNVKIVSIATKTSFARDEYKDYVREMNDWQRAQAEKFDWLTFIETADLCKNEKGEYIFENYLDDKLHFGPKAYAVIEKRVKAVLDSLCVS